jgi:glycosyltransferase involved in cell wall biosynthesis
MTPCVTTIIPAYNAGKWIQDAISSALAQQIEQEILVVDDGSTDDTAVLAAAFGPPVRVISKPNGGVSSARNAGLRAAQGTYVALLDADDCWYPGKLARQIEAMTRFPQAGTVICDEAHVDDHGTVRHPSYFRTKHFAPELPDGMALASHPLTWLVRESFFPTSGVLMRRDTATQVGFFDESLSIVEDRDYWIRLALAAPVVIVPEVLLRYRVGNENSLAMLGRARWASNLEIVLGRHADALRCGIDAEGRDGRQELGAVFHQLADIHWYSDHFRDAARLYLKSSRHGHPGFLRFVLCRSGVVPVLRSMRRIMGR